MIRLGGRAAGRCAPPTPPGTEGTPGGEERLAEHTQVITYDRAGLGWSDAGPAPTAARYVAQLHAVLDACLPDGDHVLVGHSLGGLIARLHAQQHRERLAGLVQVDATPDEVAGNHGVELGLAVSGVMASDVTALALFGMVRLLLRLRVFPLYPEQRTFEAQVSPDQRRAWIGSVARSMGPGGATGPETALGAALRPRGPTARGRCRSAAVRRPADGCAQQPRLGW